MKRLAEIEARKAEIRSLLQSDEMVDLEALKNELAASYPCPVYDEILQIIKRNVQRLS